jgi:4-hydroxy-tetrahydrodipicolinate reductase
MQRVGVLGAGGRMGRTVCQAISEDPEMELVAAIDPEFAGIDLRQLTGVESNGVQVASDAAELERADAEVVVDFTVAAAALKNMRWCATRDIHAVVGTTGLSSSELDELKEAFDASGANCVVAANFAIGAVLMARFAELAAPFMDGVEIIELHHDNKVDAPSGTALHIAKLIADSRTRSTGTPCSADPTTVQTVEGTRGGEAPGGVRVHSIRLPGLVAHHEIIFGAVGQTLAIRHDAFDRTSFMPGVLLAVRSVVGADGLTIGLGPLLGF